MQFVAHRGASLECPENSLASLCRGAELGACAVECDVRATRDGQYVIFHDDDLKRLCGREEAVGEVTLAEMRQALKAVGRSLLTLSELLEGYREAVPILLHIKLTQPEEPFLTILRETKTPFIAGVTSIAMLDAVRAFLPAERILAFMPGEDDWREFAAHGAGIIRLWEMWLDRITPNQVRAAFPVKVWIMACENGCMNGSREGIRRAEALGADGMLLNDIRMATQGR